ncbi:HTH-type transcriptional regulator GltC [Paenibacillus solanacearum]|uniref:HTH-type transcriptional regulator GltC n=1 Tax=Paenibacillus solanacearum TaxID=2048548 RepID=A0A916NGN8_9BACL|nr:LysR family transcriptional regulator [Paenibacillus solanacearum]CAG7609007.1 HTH-type transcriptional regulator GltC [Paenibacillus solanacearum]
MEWQQLEYFHTVAELQHFTMAARKLSVAQPTLSRSISKLESELGVPLFDRQGRGITLNAYGRMFHARTARILQEMQEAKQELLYLQNPDTGTVSLAFLKSLGISRVPKLVQGFLELYPNVTFQLYQNATRTMLDQLERGEIDFCLASMTESRPGIQWTELWTEELYVFVPHSHPLAGKQYVTLQDISGERFVVLKQGYSTRAILDQLFSEIGVEPLIAFEGEEVVSVMGFVSANLGIALLPQVDELGTMNVSRLSIADARCERRIGLAWREGRFIAPAAERFRNYLIEATSMA